MAILEIFILVIVLAIIFFILVKMRILIINVNQDNLAELVEQARLVKMDLEKLLNQSLDLSQEISVKLEKMTKMLKENASLPKAPLEEMEDISSVHMVHQQAALKTLEETTKLLKKTNPKPSSFRTALNHEMGVYPIEKLGDILLVEPGSQLDKVEETSFLELEQLTNEPSLTIQQIDTTPKREEAYEQVQRLLEQGLSIKEIAKRMNRGQGEIQLLFNLYHKKN